MQLFLIADPQNGSRDGHILSIIAGILAAGGGLILLESVYIGFLFGYLAFQSFQALQAT